MSIKQKEEIDCSNLAPESNSSARLKVFFKSSLKFFSKLAIAGLFLVVYNFFGSFHIGYGSDGDLLHKTNNNDLSDQLAKTPDSYASDLESLSQTNYKLPDYEVKSGDTIWGIAEKYSIKADDILQANDLVAESVIKPGQKLILPSDDKIPSNFNLEKIDFQTRAVLVNENNSAGSQVNNLEDDNRSEKKPFDYEVESGDTISNIAERYNLKISTILWANDLTAKSIIKPGQNLVLLPVDGVLHEVKKGDIIGKIAALHKADAQKTQDYNGITDPTKIYPGDMIVVPNGEPLPPLPPKPKVFEAPKVSETLKPSVDAGNNQTVSDNAASNNTDKLLWPTSAKIVTQGYGTKHRGIDIANGGTPPIFASHDGTVEFAGRSGDWGKTILLRRDDGLVTRYSHALEIYVAVGQSVKTGETIAKIGTTGRSTGYHLDFRVYKNGVAVNPLKLLQ